MPSDVERSSAADGLGMRDFWFYVWLRRLAVMAAHVSGLGLTLILSVLSRPGTSEYKLLYLIMQDSLYYKKTGII